MHSKTEKNGHRDKQGIKNKVPQRFVGAEQAAKHMQPNSKQREAGQAQNKVAENALTHRYKSPCFIIPAPVLALTPRPLFPGSASQQGEGSL